MADTRPRVLTVPGLWSSGSQHWQTHWEAKHSWQRVQQRDWEHPDRQEWVATLQSIIAAQPASPILAAHSLGCSLVAQWVADTGGGGVAGALLVAPSDVEAPDYPVEGRSFSAMPLVKLPFPSIVVASTDDEYVSLDRARMFAAAWGSEFVTIGPAGHINGASGYGPWPEGETMPPPVPRIAYSDWREVELMDAGIIAGLAAIAIAAIADAFLVMKWNRTYFTAGIPLFVRRIERPEGIAGVALDDLETSSKTAGGAPLLFHRFAPDLIAFRDKVFGGVMHYIPIMHGVIRHDPAEGVVRVMGILNWFPIVFLIAFAALLGKKVVDLLPMVLFVFGVIYFIQAVRYNRVAKKLGTVRTVVAG